MRAGPLGRPGALCRTGDCRGYQVRAAAHGQQRGGSRRIDQADKAPSDLEPPWEIPSEALSFSGSAARRGSGPDCRSGVLLHQSRFDSERSYGEKHEDDEEAQTQGPWRASWARSSAVEHSTFNRRVESSNLSGLTNRLIRGRLTAGRWFLAPATKVRILPPELQLTASRVNRRSPEQSLTAGFQRHAEDGALDN